MVAVCCSVVFVFVDFGHSASSEQLVVVSLLGSLGCSTISV